MARPWRRVQFPPVSRPPGWRHRVTPDAPGAAARAPVGIAPQSPRAHGTAPRRAPAATDRPEGTACLEALPAMAPSAPLRPSIAECPIRPVSRFLAASSTSMSGVPRKPGDVPRGSAVTRHAPGRRRPCAGRGSGNGAARLRSPADAFAAGGTVPDRPARTALAGSWRAARATLRPGRVKTGPGHDPGGRELLTGRRSAAEVWPGTHPPTRSEVT
jgi:hypothetical protein